MKTPSNSYFGKSSLIFLALSITVLSYVGGYANGIKNSFQYPIKEENLSTIKSSPKPPTPAPTSTKKQSLTINYSGPELWETVNQARIQHGVSPLSQRDILCTIAAIRLSQIRELKKLDGHEGFRSTYDKYKDDPSMPTNVSEFLISGYPTAEQAVSGWLDTLGHKKLITGGEYVWGCIYAGDGFGVAIAGY